MNKKFELPEALIIVFDDELTTFDIMTVSGGDLNPGIDDDEIY